MKYRCCRRRPVLVIVAIVRVVNVHQTMFILHVKLGKMYKYSSSFFLSFLFFKLPCASDAREWAGGAGGGEGGLP